MKDNIEEKFDGEELEELLGGIISGRLDTVHVHNFVRQALTTTRKEAIEECLAILPEEVNMIHGMVHGPSYTHGHNTAVALMRERLLDKIK